MNGVNYWKLAVLCCSKTLIIILQGHVTRWGIHELLLNLQALPWIHFTFDFLSVKITARGMNITSFFIRNSFKLNYSFFIEALNFLNMMCVQVYVLFMLYFDFWFEFYWNKVFRIKFVTVHCIVSTLDQPMVFVCFQSTESDLSLESDDLATYTNVSFAEFLQQYKELSDWLNHIEAATKVNVSSLSEKYLNQVRYHGNVIVEIKHKGTKYWYCLLCVGLKDFLTTLPFNRIGRFCFKIIPILKIIPIVKMLSLSDDFPRIFLWISKRQGFWHNSFGQTWKRCKVRSRTLQTSNSCTF